MRNAWWICVLFSGLATGASAQDTEYGLPLEDKKKDAVEEARKMLKAMGEDKNADKEGSPENEAGKAAGELRKAMDDDRIRESVTEGYAGQTRRSRKFPEKKLVALGGPGLPG